MATKVSQKAELLAKAADLHSRIITFDSHVDIPLNFGSAGHEADRDGPTKFDLPKVARGRLSGASLVVTAAAARPTPENLARLLNDQETRFRLITGLAEAFPAQVGLARSPDEFRKLVGEGKFAIVLSFQNASPLAPQPESLDPWIARGAQMFAFTFIGNNK